MTDEYREQLLNYITNSVIETEQTSNPFDQEYIEYQNNLNVFITNGILEETSEIAEFAITNYLQIEGNSNYLLYGDYWTTEHARVLRGFFVILDGNLQPVKLILKFDSGTLLRQFYVLNINEEGQIYGVDNLRTWSQDGQTYTDARRFIMLNNILTSNLLTGEYSVTLRASYNLQYNNTYVYQIYKKIGSADYMMVGTNEDSSYKICVVTLKINVGQSNEWNRYTSDYTVTGSLNSYLTWDDNTTRLKLITTQIVDSTAKYLELLFNGETFSVNLTYTIKQVSRDYSGNIIRNLIIKDDDEVYYQVGYYDIILKTNYNTGTYEVLYININDNNPRINFGKNKNTVFISHYYSYYVEEFERHSVIKFGLISGNNVYFSDEYETPETPGYLITGALFIIKSSFNLNELCLQAGNYLIMFPVDYNALNYNGKEYLSYNMLNSHKVTLYNDDRLIFSRNLYNKTINRNVTASIGQIPNNMLNDIQITKELLNSQTNMVLTENEDNLTKNLYETVYLNFINTINVIDEDTNKSYPLVANYINSNINIGTESNYNDTTLSKVRINYDDDSSKIININWRNINKYNKTTFFVIYASKVVKSIDYISNDETTIYLTKNIETEEGKYYYIEQKVRTGNKPSSDVLNYNDEAVLYKNETTNVVI